MRTRKFAAEIYWPLLAPPPAPPDFQTFLWSCLFLLSSSFVGTEIIVWLSIDRYIMEKLWNWKIILPLGGRKMFFIQNVTYIGSVGYRHTACSREIVHREGHTFWVHRWLFSWWIHIWMAIKFTVNLNIHQLKHGGYK